VPLDPTNYASALDRAAAHARSWLTTLPDRPGPFQADAEAIRAGLRVIRCGLPHGSRGPRADRGGRRQDVRLSMARSRRAPHLGQRLVDGWSGCRDVPRCRARAVAAVDHK